MLPSCCVLTQVECRAAFLCRYFPATLIEAVCLPGCYLQEELSDESDDDRPLSRDEILTAMHAEQLSVDLQRNGLRARATARGGAARMPRVGSTQSFTSVSTAATGFEDSVDYDRYAEAGSDGEEAPPV